MTLKPHLAFGLVTGVVVTSCFQMAEPAFIHRTMNIVVGIIGSLAGSVAPDLDAAHSPLSRLLPCKTLNVVWRGTPS